MLDENPVIPVRRPFAVPSAGADRRAAMKARIGAIHVPDGLFKSTADMFRDLVNDIEDGKPTHAIVLRAPTGVGKSHVFDRLYDPRLAPFSDAYGPCIPCVSMSAPTPCNLATLGLELYYCLTGERLNPRARAAEVWFRLRTQLYNLGVRLIMLDEFHHLVETANVDQRQVVVSTLKSLLIGENPGHAAALGKQIGVLPDTVARHPIALVIAGMPILSEAIDLDHQLARRCWTVDFKRDDLAEPGGEKRFVRFLETYDREIGLLTEPRLTDPDMALRLHRASGGFRGRAAALIKEAAFLAINEGVGVLEKGHFERVFELTYKVGAARNPFVVADPRGIGPLPEIERTHLTRLRGAKPKSNEED